MSTPKNSGSLGPNSEDAEALLKEYGWPGNVRELEHVIRSAMIMSHGELIRLHHLPPRLTRIAGNVLEIDGHAPDGSFEEQLANFKLKLAQAAVKKNHGNKTLAARSPNISRPYLHRLLRIESDEQFPDESLGAFS
jgi:DNA-binding NtrC family response regulator